MKLLMLAGAGSVGKTALMNACKEMAEARGLKVATHYSSTRDTYARHGLTNESDALKDPEFNKEFQHEVMSDNIFNLKKKMDEFWNVDLLIADRTPYDYISYYFSVFNRDLKLETVNNKRQQCDDTMVALTQRKVDDINIIFLPYPTSWATDTESSDGWRSDTTGKNLIWSSVVEAELADAKRRLVAAEKMLSPLFINRLPSFMERGSVEARAVGALAQTFPHLR